MQQETSTFEIHVHGQVSMDPDIAMQQVIEALEPIWKYKGSKTFEAGSKSFYENEPGIVFKAEVSLLQICWTTHGEDDFREAIEEACLSLNEISAAGASIEVTLDDISYEGNDIEDMSFDCDDDASFPESRDDFLTFYVGPNPAEIMKAQRDQLVGDVVITMQEHFEPEKLAGVIGEIDKLFAQRLSSVTSAMDFGSLFKTGGKPPANGHGHSHPKGCSGD